MKRKQTNEKLIMIGNILRELRLNSYDHNISSIEKFIDAPSDKGLLPYNWISSKSLSNIELGYNLPSLETLKLLSIAYQVELIEIIEKIEPYIPMKIDY